MPDYKLNENLVLNELNEKGVIWSEMKKDSELNLGIASLYLRRVIKGLNDLGIKFINESYCFTYADNRYNVRVVQLSDKSLMVVSDLTPKSF